MAIETAKTGRNIRPVAPIKNRASENPTNVVPVEYGVLIEIDEKEEKSAGGVWMPDIYQEREQEARDRGKLVAANEMAFSDWTGRIPQVGEEVIFNKYAGAVVAQHPDNRNIKYRLCNDKEVKAVLEEKE